VSVAKHRVQGLPVCARHYVSQSSRKGRAKSARHRRESAAHPLHDVLPDNPIAADWLESWVAAAKQLHRHGISIEVLCAKVTHECKLEDRDIKFGRRKTGEEHENGESDLIREVSWCRVLQIVGMGSIIAADHGVENIAGIRSMHKAILPILRTGHG